MSTLIERSRAIDYAVSDVAYAEQGELPPTLERLCRWDEYRQEYIIEDREAQLVSEWYARFLPLADEAGYITYPIDEDVILDDLALFLAQQEQAQQVSAGQQMIDFEIGVTDNMKIELYTSKRVQECGLCGSKQVKYVVTGEGGTQYACKNKSCLGVVKAVVSAPGDVEDDLELDVTALDTTVSTTQQRPAPTMPAAGDTPLLTLKQAVNRWTVAARYFEREGHPRKAKKCYDVAAQYQIAVETLEPERFKVI